MASSFTSQPAANHPEVEMSEREQGLMRTHNLMTDKDGNLVPRPVDVDVASRLPPHALSSTVTLNVAELVEMIAKSGSRYAAPAPVSPPSGLGNPGALGLAGFAMTTFVLSVFNTGAFLDPKVTSVFLPLALLYGGITQFIAGLFEFRAPNTFGATAFCSYGAFWVSFWYYLTYVVPTFPADAMVGHGSGLFLLCWTFFTLYMFIGSLRVSKCLTILFGILTLAFLFLTIGNTAPNAGCVKVGGWLGIICAFVAWYGSAAIVINNTHGRTVLPVGVYLKDEGFFASWAKCGANKLTVG